MRILVAICTYNRAYMLRETLSSLCTLQPPEGATWSILVVNNRCTDDTDQVIAAFSDRLPIFRAYQLLQGLSNARNAAIESDLAAEADYIIWTDDDVLVEPGWLRAYEAAFREFPEACLFGGNVIPWFEKQPPRWLLQGWESFKIAFAERDFGTTFPLEPVWQKLPFGANYAVRAAEQRKFCYNPTLGVIGEKWLVGEEIALMQDLLREGHSGWWVAGATVRHFIPERRMTLAFLGRYFRGQGRTEAIKLGEYGMPVYRRPCWMWRRMVEAWCRFVIERIKGNPTSWSHHYVRANMLLGRLIN